MRKRYVLFCSFLMAAASLAPAQEPHPTPKPAAPPMILHHDFNPNTPTEFSGQMVDLAVEDEDEGPMMAYVAGDPASLRQIVIFHEWWGLNSHIKGTADHFAAMGYRVYAPDLYGNGVVEDGDNARARELMSEAMENPDAVQRRVNLAVEAIRRDNQRASLATMGWCFGGMWSLKAAIANPSAIKACVVYYGRLETDVDKLRHLRAPVQVVIGSLDKSITPEMAEEFKAAAIEAGNRAPIEIHVYNADHAFANPSGARFNDEAARAAWGETMRFLDTWLGGGQPPKTDIMKQTEKEAAEAGMEDQREAMEEESIEIEVE
jgi:carboxymethylenebutenolidase